MQTTARMPASRAASATAWAWLPEETAITPRFFSSSLSERILFVAPRALKAPARCRFSHLKKTSRPATSLNEREVTTGVRWTRPAMRAAASLIRSIVSMGFATEILPQRHGDTEQDQYD